MADIRFACPKCGQPLKAEPETSGSLIDCPACTLPIEVPFKSEPPPPEPPLVAEMPKNKKCPFCAETILAEAIKCRFCGEFLDGRTKDTAPPPVVVKAKGEGCFLETLNAGCLVIFAIILFVVFIIIFKVNGC